MLVFTQDPPQSVPVEHAQVPPAQYWPDAHVRPQPPQWALSVLVLTHIPLHSVPLEHTHAPAAQTCPAPHVRPQAPQLEASARASMHDPAHRVRPAAQVVVMHTPEVHI